MFNIDWHQLEKNAEGSPQDFFEKFNYQIAVRKYASLGTFEYDYDTPGSEFYLSLTSDNKELNAKAGDDIGWQAKFWRGKKDDKHSPFDNNELIINFKKSLEYKPNLMVWIICTPGQPSNKKPHLVRDSLESKLKAIKHDIVIHYWNKPNYEAIFHSKPEKFASIFNRYFSTQYLSFNSFESHSNGRLNILKEKRYFSNLYTPSKADRSVLTSIIYDDLLNNLQDKIKHSLEEREKIIGSYLYREVINNFLTSNEKPEPSGDNKEIIVKVKKLIDEMLALHEKFYIYKERENTLKFIKYLLKIIESKRNNINQLIDAAGLDDRYYNDMNIDYSSDVENVNQLIDYLYSIASNCLDTTVKIYRLLTHASRQVFHIVGEAGFGKTNFACHVTEHLLGEKLPVLLIPASEIKGSEKTIMDQIKYFLGISDEIKFQDFIGVLDSIGFEKRCKVPIIIDGLNETQPTASVWNPELQYIINDLKKFDNVLIITTCRNAYLEPVFDKKDADDSSLFIKLEGFKENVEEAIRKYFEQYSITPLNPNFDKDLFNDPLLLRIFSQANKGKSVEIDETSKYKAVDSYLNEVVESISTINKRVDPVQKSNTLRGILGFSLELWNSRSKRVEYKDGLGLLPIFDPDFDGSDYFSTITYKIIDEGLLFRNPHGGVEFAEFTHDLVGGYCIAKSVIFNNKKVEDIISVLTSTDFIKKVASEELTDKHPLAEDILKAVVYLAPRETGKQLFELVDNNEVIKASLQILRIIISTPEGIGALINIFKNISPESPILPHLLESLLDEVLRRNENIILTELLESVLLNLSSSQIDLNWNEVIRRKSNRITPYLYQTIELFESGKEDNEHIHFTVCFISLLLSSTNRYLRDMATKSLVAIGRRYPETLVDVFLRLERTKDIYILERLIASICGVFLTIDDKNLLFRVCKYLEENYIENIKTTHVLILDYIITLLDYAEIKFKYDRSLRRPVTDALIEWQRDSECISKVTDATWGFGPVGYDFAKYKIGSYLAQYGYEKDSKLPTLKEALAMVVWRTKDLGYIEELFADVEKALNDQEHKRYGYNSSYASTNYRKKYRDIAFYELYGHNIIKGISPDFKEGDGFRVSSYYIDPTFPNIPTKRQLITCCLLPKHPDDVQSWINADNPPFMEPHHVRADIETDGSQWVMLYGHLVQEGGDDKSRISINLFTMMVPMEKADRVVEMIQNNEIRLHYLVAENHNVLAGEIPWSDNYLDGIRHEEIDGEEVELYLPVSSYYQETKSQFEIVDHAYAPSKKLAQSLGLKIDLNDFNLYSKHGEKVSSFLHDNHSSFIYFQKDLLQKYLNDTRQTMIWIEIASKYGSFGEHKSKYKPSFKDCRMVKKYN